LERTPGRNSSPNRPKTRRSAAIEEGNDLIYVVLFRAGRLPKSKYAERVAAKHPVTLDRRFIRPRPERKEE
jgi:hypothetical protein